MDMPDTTLRFGWKPDIPDQRDRKFAAPIADPSLLPAKVDLRDQCPPVYDQGRIQSCTANAIAALMAFVLKKQKGEIFAPSRLFIYFNERAMDNTVSTDSGAFLRDGMKSVAKLGACSESTWPYDDTPPADFFTRVWAPAAKPASKPPAGCYDEAAERQVLSYQRLDQSLVQMKGCLAAGYPFVFGFSVYSAFAGAAIKKDGVLNLPEKSEGDLGGHAVMAVGYDDASGRFIIRNSHGEGWGQQGYFTMPYAYLLSGDLSADFWTLTMVE